MCVLTKKHSPIANEHRAVAELIASLVVVLLSCLEGEVYLTLLSELIESSYKILQKKIVD